MARYNRRKRGRFNWERSAQGALSGAATGFSVAGPKGAVIGGFVGGFTGGMSGRDTTVDRVPYDEAIRIYSKERRQQARYAGNEQSARAGAIFASRGINNSEMAAGAIAANRGRINQAAESDIANFSANVNLRIAEAERKAQAAEDEMTRQGWLDLAGQLGLMAVSGEFTPEKQVSEQMLDSLRRSHPKEVDRWVRGRIGTDELVGIYDRYAQIHGEPGSLRRRFHELEANRGGGALPQAVLPERSRAAPSIPDTLRKPATSNEQMRRETIPTSPEGGQGEPQTEMNLEDKPIAPLPEGAELGGATDRLRQVMNPDDFETLMALYPDLLEIIGERGAGVIPAGERDTPTSSRGSANVTETWKREKRGVSTVTVGELQSADKWGAGESDYGFWKKREAEMQKIIDNPASDYAYQQAVNQMQFIQNELHRLETGEDLPPASMPATEIQGLGEHADAMRNHATGRGQRFTQEQVPRQNTIRRLPAPELEDVENVGSVEILPPQAERRGKPNPIGTTRQPGRRRALPSADTQEEGTTPPPPPNLEDVKVETTPVKPKSTAKRADTSMGKFRKMEADDTRGGWTPLVVSANRWVGKNEQKDKTALMKYFDAHGIEYNGKSFDPTKTPWCAAFLNAALMDAGYEPLATNSYAAREYINYGTEGTGEVGDIAVWQNHVGIVLSVAGDKIRILGGNQKDGVTIIDKSELDKKTNFLGYRTPVAQQQQQQQTQPRFAR